MSLENDIMANAMQEFDYAGAHYTYETFAAKFNIKPDEAIAVVAVLAAQGKISYGTEQQIADKNVRSA